MERPSPKKYRMSRIHKQTVLYRTFFEERDQVGASLSIGTHVNAFHLPAHCHSYEADKQTRTLENQPSSRLEHMAWPTLHTRLNSQKDPAAFTAVAFTRAVFEAQISRPLVSQEIVMSVAPPRTLSASIAIYLNKVSRTTFTACWPTNLAVVIQSGDCPSSPATPASVLE